ncbi:hypothetical protein ACT17_14585 [Mycolicibacterium conceptionense]|uniref:Uncharacterized protein n=1 Tax=Mycolicibacterium conceptionense TaxID=451644 RepID=A0A0J8U937_9MYCO|nr:hypothetical protein [Mycolicibacterium conceptionense]KMV17522.1 hypothetical protein ACT17_14585 [Mycolicibacterium conceptionense]
MAIPEPLIDPADAQVGREHEYTVAFRGDVEDGYWRLDNPFTNHTAYRDSDGRWHFLTAVNYPDPPREQSLLHDDDELVVIAKREHPLGTWGVVG